jgi:hypothetical protein
MSSDYVTARFIRGLQEYDLTQEEIKGWKYVGGNRGSGLKYWILCTDNEELPEHHSTCVCGHDIIENCYIESPDGNDILVLGNHCVKRFIAKSSRTCEICEKPHRNRKINRCNECKKNFRK